MLAGSLCVLAFAGVLGVLTGHFGTAEGYLAELAAAQAERVTRAVAAACR